jgi:hypothetical protein
MEKFLCLERDLQELFEAWTGIWRRERPVGLAGWVRRPEGVHGAPWAGPSSLPIAACSWDSQWVATWAYGGEGTTRPLSLSAREGVVGWPVDTACWANRAHGSRKLMLGIGSIRREGCVPWKQTRVWSGIGQAALPLAHLALQAMGLDRLLCYWRP